MPNSVSVKVSLPAEMAEATKRRVASGAYASESEVVREGLRALDAREAIVEEWLRTEGVARFDAYHRDESQIHSPSEVIKRLHVQHAERAKSRER
jgi:putative addiction module CopG family antidote